MKEDKLLHRNQPKFFSDINVGDNAQFEITVTEEMHNNFSKFFGDFNPIHCDEKLCSKTRFKKKIGYAYMLTGFLSRLYGEYLPGGTSICIKQDAKFIKPYFIGDKIKIIGKVVHKSESTRFVEIYTEIYRNEKECIFKGNGIVQVIFEKKMIQPIYKSDKGPIYYEDFINALKKIGVNKGDVLFVHSDISAFGKLATTDREFFLQSLVDLFKESVGPQGTIIMPTFTYSFCKNETYDVAKSKSTVGTLTEYFRKQKDVERTVQPIFSAAIYGNHKKELLKISKHSFDKESILGKLHKLRGKMLIFGSLFQHSCTFLHYIEKMHGIPYRYEKKFKGKIIHNSKEYEDEYEYSVRYLNKNVNVDLTRLEKHLLEKKIMKKIRIGDGEIKLVDCDGFFKEGQKVLDKDIYFFLKEVPNL